MKSKLFSYKVNGIVLEPVDDNLKASPEFDRKALVEQLKSVFATGNFKPDERTLSFKIKDEQLFIEGIAVENEEPKSVGFKFGK